jgi:hypothetical protein
VRNNLKVMTKLGAILVAPVVLLLVLACLGVRSRQAEAEEARQVLALTKFVGAATSLLSEVERESLQAARYSGSGGSPEIRALYEQQQQATIAATEEVQRQIQAVDPAARDPRVKEAVTNLTGRLAALQDHRATVTQRSTDGLNADAPYRHVADGLTEVIRQVTNSFDDPILFQRMSSVTSVAALGAARSHTANPLAVAIEVGYYPAQLPKQGMNASKRTLMSESCGDRPAEARADTCSIYEQIQVARNDFATAEDRFRAVGSASDALNVRAQSDDSPLQDIINTAYAEGGKHNDLTPAAIGATPAEFAEAANRAIDGYEATVRYLLLDAGNADSVVSIAQAQADQADQEALSYLFGTVIAILVAGIATYFVGRSITKGMPREPREVEGASPTAAMPR